MPQTVDPVPPLLVLSPTVPQPVVTVIERALAKTPEARYSTVTEFAESLAGAAATDVKEAVERAVQPPPKQRVAETAAASPLPVAKPAANATPREPAGRPTVRRWAVRSAAFAVLAIAAAVFWPQLKGAFGPAGGAQPAAPQTPAAARPIDSTRLASAQPVRVDSATVPAVDTSRPTQVTAGASIALRGVPRRSTIMLDGRRVRSSRVSLQPSVMHVLSVSLSGYETWAETLQVRQGQNLVRSVTLHPIARRGTSGQPAGPAYLTVGSRPLAAITINGRPAPSNPIAGFEVPAGVVRLHFTVSETSGTWSYDTTVTVAPGERKNVGRITLVKKP